MYLLGKKTKSVMVDLCSCGGSRINAFLVHNHNLGWWICAHAEVVASMCFFVNNQNPGWWILFCLHVCALVRITVRVLCALYLLCMYLRWLLDHLIPHNPPRPLFSLATRCIWPVLE